MNFQEFALWGTFFKEKGFLQKVVKKQNKTKIDKYQFKNGFAEQKSSIWWHHKQQNAEISFFVYFKLRDENIEYCAATKFEIHEKKIFPRFVV